LNSTKHANTFSRLNGLGAGPAETAQPTIIADVIFLHDRGKYQTLYFAFYFGSLMVGPIISGPMAANLGWRSFWWLNTAVLGFSAVCCMFLFPETKFNRSFMPSDSYVTASPPLKAGSAEQVEENPAQNHAETVATDHADPEKTAPVQPQATLEAKDRLTHVHTHKDPWLGRGKPSKAQWKLWQPYEGNIFFELYLPWKLLCFPIVEFSAFVVSWTASSFLTLNLTQSQAFASPPYNFTSTKIGFFNFAILIGALIGLFTAGPLSDLVAAWLTKRNRGIREPEMRLLSMVPYVILMVIGNVIVAVGYQKAWDWKVCLD
jgi:MFS family permease